MKRKTLIIIAVIVSLILIYINTMGNYIFVLNVNWNTGIPRSDKVVYIKDSGASFLGDGMTYSVHSYKFKKKIEKLNNLHWTGSTNSELEDEINTSFKLQQLNIDSQYMIDFNDDYLYYVEKRKGDTEKLYIIYMYNQKKIYIIEDIS